MAQKTNYSMDDIINELMKLDRLQYLEILSESENPLTSYDITKKILVSDGIKEEPIDKKLLRKKNPSINTRLKTMEDMGILRNEEGKYSLDIAGLLFLHAREKLSKSREILDTNRMFFETHNFQDIPVEFRWQIYKLSQTNMISNAYEFMDSIEENLKKVERKIYLLTEHLRDIPNEIIQRIQKKEIDIAILYQCHNPPLIEKEDEQKVFKELTKNLHKGIEFRFFPLQKRSSIYVSRSDSKWALFTLSTKASGTIDRNQAFCGDNIEFITWCRDLLYHLWWEEGVKIFKIEEILEANSL